MPFCYCECANFQASGFTETGGRIFVEGKRLIQAVRGIMIQIKYTFLGWLRHILRRNSFHKVVIEGKKERKRGVGRNVLIGEEPYRELKERGQDRSAW